MSDFGSKARQGTAAIGDSRKAELAKELDPTVLRVSSHIYRSFRIKRKQITGSRMDRRKETQYSCIIMFINGCDMA